MKLTPKGRSKTGQFRNKRFGFKERVRRMIDCGPDDDVLDLFAGDGMMYRHCWERAKRGATVDVDDKCVRLAAMERPGWSVFKVDAIKALRGGIWVDRRFSVIDVDCFGAPWPFIEAMFSCGRNLSNDCRMVLTDHYMAKRNIASEEKTLGFRKPGTPEDYLRKVDEMLKRTVVSQGWNYDRSLYRDGSSVQHLILLTRSHKGGGPDNA